jgi:uncharacterized protein (TIGR03083 family)
VTRQRIVVDALAEVWSSLDELLSEVDDKEWEIATPCPGWDVRAIVAHIIGTEREMSGEPTPDIDLDRAALPHVHRDGALVAERWIESLRSTSPELLREQFAAITTRRLDMLASMTEHEWATASFYPLADLPYEHVIYIRVLDCWIHEQDIRDATNRPGHESGLGVDITLDAMSVAMGTVVGTNAGIERGNSVTFALTQGGRVVREIHVDVGNEAEVVAALTGPATTKLTMPVGVWTRRCAGRVGPDAFRDQIALEGDLVIAERVLANQSYMS